MNKVNKKKHKKTNFVVKIKKQYIKKLKKI